MLKSFVLALCLFSITVCTVAQQRARDAGIKIGVLPTGTANAITDVGGVRVGHTTVHRSDSIRTGVTAVLPHSGNLFQQKVPAAIFVGNGFGKLAGVTQVQELGNMESPVLLTNTLNVATAIEAGVEHTLLQPGNEKVQSVNVVVGETNDGYLNDIRGRHVKKEDVMQAIRNAKSGAVAEGAVGAGTGT
ncbi:MAG: S58 family peptidase, partial [Sphingobacteriales bacterium]